MPSGACARARRVFATLAKLHAALSSANEAILRAGSPAELLSRACEIAVDAGDFVLGTVFLFDHGSGQLKRVARSGPAAAYPLTETPIYDSFVVAAWQNGEMMIANDYQTDPRTRRRREHPRPYPHHLGAGAVWPLFVDGKPAGVFSLLHAEKNAFSEDMTLLLQRLADNMSFALANFAHEARRLEAEHELRESVNERIGTEERLQQSLERFEIVARATNDVVWDWNLVTDQLWLNDNFCSVFGYAPAEVGAYVDSWTSRIHPDDVARVREEIRSAIERGERVWTAEYRLRRRDGSYANVLDRGLPLRDSAGQPVRMIGAMVDISERKRAERKLALHAQRQEIIARLGQFALGGADLEQVLAEAARVLRAGGCDVAAIIERVGDRGHEFLVRAACGENAEASVGKSKLLPAHSKWSAMLDSATGAVEHDRKYFEAREQDRPWSFWLRRLGSGVYVPIRSDTGPFGILMMGSLRDAAFDVEDLSFAEAIAHVLSTAVRRHHAQTRLAYMAEFDTLTGLPNRNLLQDRLNQSVAQARRRQWQGAVLFIDLDRFKLINDTLGHHVGDRLIAEVGRRIRQCLRGGDTVGRVSGDEFGVVLTDLAQADDAALVAQKILDGLSRPFDLGGNEAYVTASIGISVFPADGADAETLLKNADMAMYRAKELTRNAYCFFTAEMNERSVAKLQLNTDLRRAIERGEFVLHYQPKVDLRDGRIHGVEALLRWNHPQRGVVLPAEFIPALEDSGPHPAGRRMGARRGRAPDRRVAARGLRPGAGGGQSLGQAVPAQRSRRADPHRALGHAGAGRHDRARDHRELPDGRARRSGAPARRPARGGAQDLGGRFRHRLFEPVVPHAPAADGTQDRPGLRARRGDEHRIGLDRAGGHRHGAQPRLHRHRRRRRNRGAGGLPAPPRLRPRTGIPVRRADERGRAGRAPAARLLAPPRPRRLASSRAGGRTRSSPSRPGGRPCAAPPRSRRDTLRALRRAGRGP